MKRKSGLLLCVAMLVPVVLGGCPGIDSGATHFLDARTNGMNVTVQVGDRLIVALRANPSTGFAWQVTTIDSASLQLVQEQFLFDNTTDLAGAPGTSVFEFDAIGTGSSTLSLENRRAGEPAGTPPAQTFSFGLLVE